MRSVKTWLAVAAVACATLGSAAAAALYSPADLPRIVDPKPRLPGWSFDRSDPYIYPIPTHDPAFTLHEWLLADSPTKEQKAMAAKLAKAGFWVGRHLVWEGSGPEHGAKLVVFAHLFHTVAGAQTASKLLRFPGSSRTRGLGPDAWAASDGKTGAVLVWRRANLLMYVAVDCDDSDCGFSPMPPGRAWAAQIDARAMRGG